ncbi:MAG: disulfide isomerase [Polaromonas sp. 39-63-203]|jgi:thiol:disulfide interchange protein DsbC|uniref:DsbC family protein n=1 Tax=Polaromonas sp. TaxID=1869339 RepID=UPI000BC367C2|nr:DsbC family protein [Polaromonas sp.]OYY53036.1 MAG: disulfide isomerase [Polaromonas sp. 35-63-240]OYY89579.1 MAG: disulfide isomerase [Polaromonas sp. 28-63-22]OYZ83680.1 MAG: disulfide isomerase [Polaromonas sp. 24-62-144]OZA97895.1 MAG: disulfide isomerase [Polaromonas sp. 39-63-203]HQS30740.1 DsbC family protein [Polaromonas sp.]
MKLLQQIVLAGMLVCSLGTAMAQEAVIRKNLAERLPNLPKIDEVSKTPMNGLYELRLNDSEIFYTDAEGNFLIQGHLIDTKARRNLTEERVDKLSAIDFAALPLKDAFTVVRGNGKRKMAVFEDPNCGYCKRFEKDLQKVSDVTVYMFLYPILSPDSIEKSKNIWCTKDKAKAWQDMMVRDQPAPKATCDTTAIERNVAFGKKHKITGTPTVFFVDGSRVPGAIGAPQVEKLLAEAKPEAK